MFDKPSVMTLAIAAAILAFIGVKLVLHALHENNLAFINEGKPVPVVEISTGLSLGFIIGTLIFTVVASLLSKAGKAQTAINNARRHAVTYLDLSYTADLAERERIYRLLVQEEAQVLAMDLKYRNKAKDVDEIREQVAEAHRQHASYLAT